MKITAQIKYANFNEIFNVDLEGDSMSIELKEIRKNSLNLENILTLDLASNIKEGYSAFPFLKDDLVLIQAQENFVISFSDEIERKWYKFQDRDLCNFILSNSDVYDVIKYINEDKSLLMNSLFSDIIRNDYSYSELNRKVKFLKTSYLLKFITEKFNPNFSRIIFDETLIGDIEANHIIMALQYANKEFISICKINNVSKILSLLEREKLISKSFKFIEEAFFVNKLLETKKAKVIFGDGQEKFDYHIEPLQNYLFELENNKIYSLNVANKLKKTVWGKVFIFNGDEKDLMLS